MGVIFFYTSPPRGLPGKRSQGARWQGDTGQGINTPCPLAHVPPCPLAALRRLHALHRLDAQQPQPDFQNSGGTGAKHQTTGLHRRFIHNDTIGRIKRAVRRR